MANLTYTDNSIVFGDVKLPAHYTQGIASASNYTVDGKTASSRVTGEIDNSNVAFNAIDIDWNGAKLKGFDYNYSDTKNVTINTTGDLLNYIEKAYYQAYTGNNTNNAYNFNFLFAPKVSTGNFTAYSLLNKSNDSQLITGSSFMNKEHIVITESNHQYYNEESKQWLDLRVLDINVVESGSKTDIEINNQVFDLQVIDLNDPLLSSEYFATSDLQLLYCKVTGELVTGETTSKEITYYTDSTNDYLKLSNKFALQQGVGLIEHKVKNIFIGSLDTNFPPRNYPATIKTIDDLGTKILATSISYYTSGNNANGSTKLMEITSSVNEIQNLEVSLTGEGIIKIYKGNRYVNKVDSQTPIHSIPFSITLNSGKISVTTPNTSNTPSQEKIISVTWPVVNESSGELQYVTETIVPPTTNSFETLMMALTDKYSHKYNTQLVYDTIEYIGISNNNGTIEYNGDTYSIKFVKNIVNEEDTPVTDAPDTTQPEVVPDSTEPGPGPTPT